MLNLLADLNLKKVSSTRSGEYAGPCPFCGGRDRFRVWPEYRGGKWWCRQCDRQGDLIDYLRELKGMSFQEALFTVKRIRPSAFRPASRDARSKEKSVSSPSWQWTEHAEALLSAAIANMAMVSDDPDSIDFDGFVEDGKIFPLPGALRSRAIASASIQRARLGWQGFQQQDLRSAWGLPESEGHNKMTIPAGLLIPTFNLNGDLIRIRIRRKSLFNGKRYCLLPGSSTAPMILQGGDSRIVVIVESELDAILLNQEAGDLVTTIALGSASIKPDSETDSILSKSNSILVSLDTDKAGEKASQFWLDTYKQAKRWIVPVGKDPGDAIQLGLNLRTWILAGLSRDQDFIKDRPFPSDWLEQFTDTELERLAIQTIDGGLSDSEAIEAMNQWR